MEHYPKSQGVIRVSWRLALGAMLIAIVTGVVAWVVWRQLSGTQMLESSNAAITPQPVATALIVTPVSKTANIRRPFDEPQLQPTTSTDGAAAAASTKSSATEAISVEKKVIDAFSCARVERGLPAYERDARLAGEARNILERVQAEPEKPFGDGRSHYALSGQLLLDLSEKSTTPCSVGGFEVADVNGLDRSSQIAVAVTPLTIYGRTVYLTIILGQ